MGEEVWVFDLSKKEKNRLGKLDPKWLGLATILHQMPESMLKVRMISGIRRDMHVNFISK